MGEGLQYSNLPLTERIATYSLHTIPKLRQTKEKWSQFESGSESAWEDIQAGLRLSLKSMQQAFEKAKKHFPEQDKK